MNKRLISITVFLIIIATSLFWVDGSQYLGSNSLHLPVFVRHAQAEAGSSPDEVTTTNHCSITGSEIWSSTGNVHTIGVGCGDVVIEYGESLTITEGTIVKVDLGNALIVNGTLQILGSSINLVTMTSIRDDTIGGDTNGDGASSGVRGDWAGVRFNDSSADASLIDHAVIRYAGYGNYGNVHLDSSSPTIQYTVLSNGVHPVRANLTSFPTLNGNTYVDNNWNAYGLDGGTINLNATWDITDTDYFIISDIYVGAGYTLTIEPGVIVKFQSWESLIVNGALRALGTAATPIYFTSHYDDAIGGNIDGGSTLPGRGNWCSIRFSDSSIDATSLIDHSIVRYAGCSDYGNVHLDSASPTIQNTVLSNGVHAVRANLTSFPTLTGNTYVDNNWNAYGLDGGTFNINATWDITDTDYFIISDIYVGVGYTLTVEPGVIVKFQSWGSLTVDGALRALGTEVSPIYFTSHYDDAIGGNIDEGSTLPGRGNWCGLRFRDSSNDASSLIDNSIVRYAGCSDSGTIHLTSASPTIQNTVLSNGVHAVRANLTSFPTLTGNTYVDNNWNAYGLDGGTFNINATWDITDTDYFIISDIYVGVGYTLTVEPGVIAKFPGWRALIIDGALRALGTLANPIYFTSLDDDAIGGNIDGGSTLPGVGNWCGLQFRDSSNDATSLIDHAVVRYAGCSNYGNIHLTNASPTIRYTDLTNGYRGINATTSTPNLICNNIFGNTQYGLYNATTGTNVNAEYQWWGDATGPYHSTNLSGLGNAVTDGVDFTPWATSPCVEALSEITFSMATYSVSEAGGSATITVNLSNPSSSTVEVYYTTSDGTATAGTDYSATSDTLIFSPGQTSKTFNVPITNDNMDEPSETVNLSLSSPVNAALGTPNTAVLTITDDDPTPTIVFSSATYSVGEADGMATITVNLYNPRSVDVQVNYTTSNGTATAGSDYTATSGTLIFNPGQISKTFNILITNDTMDEPDETVNLTLSSPVNAVLGTPSTAVLTIVDDDPMPACAFSSATYSVGEAGEIATITVNLSNPSSLTVTCNVATSNGTATAGADYEATSGTLTFSPGQTSKTFTVVITNDTIDESNETVNLTLSSPVNATLGIPSTAVLTIVDDDGPSASFRIMLPFIVKSGD